MRSSASPERPADSGRHEKTERYRDGSEWTRYPVMPDTTGQVVAEAAYRLVRLPGGDRLYGVGENGWNGADRAVTNR